MITIKRASRANCKARAAFSGIPFNAAVPSSMSIELWLKEQGCETLSNGSFKFAKKEDATAFILKYGK